MKSTSEDVAVFYYAGERVDCPFLALHADDVSVRGDEQGPLRAVAAQAGNEVCLARVWCLDDVDVEPERLEARREQVRDAAFVAGRVRRVDADQLDEQCCRGIARRLGGCGADNNETQDRGNRAKRSRHVVIPRNVAMRDLLERLRGQVGYDDITQDPSLRSG